MAHYAKHTMSACGHLCKHYERGRDESSEYVKFGNMDIDPSRTHLNYNLAPQHEAGHFAFIKQRISEVKCQKRADVNVMCSWVVTAPKDLPEQEHRKLFEESYRFLSERYGEKNVVSAYVHMDETTPHMHFAFVPIAIDKKKEIEKISAKERVTLLDLKSFHPDLQLHLEQALGHEVGILNEATKDGNRSISELKKESLVKEIQELHHQQKELKKEVKALQGNLQHVKAVDSIPTKKSLTGANVTISTEHFENLQKVAKHSISLATENKKLKAENTDLKQTHESVMQLRLENGKLKGEINQIGKEIDAVNKTLDRLSPLEKEKFLDKFNVLKQEKTITFPSKGWGMDR
ncbi:MobV family relaxase (plasmid) [Oscillospiraceae bacterium PP1C4]